MKVGLSKDSEKIIDFSPYDTNAAFMYRSAKGYFDAFQMLFRNSHVYFNAKNIFTGTYLNPALHNYHYAVECILKAIILFKNPESLKKTHLLINLLEIAQQNHPDLVLCNILENKETKMLFKDLDNNFLNIRYGEICIMLRPTEDMQQQELFTTLRDHYSRLENVFDVLRHGK